jgi:hypothetical protein
MLYQLPNGKCIELKVEQYARMSDTEWDKMLKELEAANFGDEVNDPFAISVLYYGPSKSDNDDDEEQEYYITEHEPDLTDISDIDKLTDSDFIDIDNIEI